MARGVELVSGSDVTTRVTRINPTDGTPYLVYPEKVRTPAFRRGLCTHRDW